MIFAQNVSDKYRIQSERLERELALYGNVAKKPTEPEHTHEFIEIEYVLAGNGYQIINGKKYSAQRGDFFFFNIGDVHSYHFNSQMLMINFLIDKDFFFNSMVVENVFLRNIETSVEKEPYLPINHIRFEGQKIHDIESIFEKIEMEFKMRRPHYLNVIRSYLTIMFFYAFRIKQETEAHSVQNEELLNVSKIPTAVIDYIDSNYKQKIHLEDVAALCNYHPAYFCKLFKQQYGINLTEYVNGIRIKKAVELIEGTDDSIENICKKVGYKEKKQFFKLFKDATGHTPSSYRKSIRLE